MNKITQLYLYQIYNCLQLLAVPDEVKPKYVNGAKWYGRRTRPEFQDTKLETSKYLQEQQEKSNVNNHLRRSASLESVEVSLTCPTNIHNWLFGFYAVAFCKIKGKLAFVVSWNCLRSSLL